MSREEAGKQVAIPGRPSDTPGYKPANAAGNGVMLNSYQDIIITE
jgi:hypothetical protein